MVDTRTILAQSDTLRPIWPQWWGAGEASVRNLPPELPYEEARRVYALGARVLMAFLLEYAGPTEIVPVSDESTGGEVLITNGMRSCAQVLAGIRDVHGTTARHDAPRILTLGGDCAVSVVPFTGFAARYGGDPAAVRIDPHLDIGTSYVQYPGYYAMAVSRIIDTGDAEVMEELAAFVPPSRPTLAGLHSWVEDDYPNIATRGLHAFGPIDLGDSTEPLSGWLEAIGCSRVAVHLDVDAVGVDEVWLRLGYDRGGPNMIQTNRVIRSLGRTADVVGLMAAEYMLRQIVALTYFLEGPPPLRVIGAGRANPPSGSSLPVPPRTRSRTISSRSVRLRC